MKNFKLPLVALSGILIVVSCFSVATICAGKKKKASVQDQRMERLTLIAREYKLQGYRLATGKPAKIRTDALTLQYDKLRHEKTGREFLIGTLTLKLPSHDAHFDFIYNAGIDRQEGLNQSDIKASSLFWNIYSLIGQEKSADEIINYGIAEIKKKGKIIAFSSFAQKMPVKFPGRGYETETFSWDLLKGTGHFNLSSNFSSLMDIKWKEEGEDPVSYYIGTFMKAPNLRMSFMFEGDMEQLIRIVKTTASIGRPVHSLQDVFKQQEGMASDIDATSYFKNQIERSGLTEGIGWFRYQMSRLPYVGKRFKPKMAPLVIARDADEPVLLNVPEEISAGKMMQQEIEIDPEIARWIEQAQGE